MEITNLGSWLKELRLDKGLDIRTLVQESNFAAAQISRIENEKSGVTLGALVHFAYGLDITLKDILEVLQLPLFLPRHKKSRKTGDLPIPLMQDAYAIWLWFQDEPQKVKERLIAGYTDIQKTVTGPGGDVNPQTLADLVWESVQALDDKFFPLQYPRDLASDHLMEIYLRGGAVTMKDVAALVQSRRRQQKLSLRDLAKKVNVSYVAISRFENNQVERVFFSQIIELDQAMNLDGGLVALAWDAAEYESGISINRMINESADEKTIPTGWDPVEKAFADTLITICRWHYVHGKEQAWWQDMKRDLHFYYP